MKTILFVDDHEVLARLSCEILHMQGYQAEYAYNATDALAKFDQEKFDIVVTDYRMAGMNGVELARTITAESTGYPSRDRDRLRSRRRMRRGGCMD